MVGPRGRIRFGAVLQVYFTPIIVICKMWIFVYWHTFGRVPVMHGGQRMASDVLFWKNKKKAPGSAVIREPLLVGGDYLDRLAFFNCAFDPEVTYVLEYTLSKMSDADIIKMAESVEPIEEP